MEKLNLEEMRIRLDEISLDENKKVMILNTAKAINILISKKSVKNINVVLQMNGMLMRQITALEKLDDKEKKKLESKKRKEPKEPEEDDFTRMLDRIKSIGKKT
jgi:hypothetical protein